MKDTDRNSDYDEPNSVTDVHASVKREQSDPQTGLEPATIRVFAICGIFLLAGGAYLGANGGFGNGDSTLLRGYEPQLPPGLETT